MSKNASILAPVARRKFTKVIFWLWRKFDNAIFGRRGYLLSFSRPKMAIVKNFLP